MARIVEILVGISALAGIATFLGFRAMARKTLRTLGRKAPDPPTGTDVERPYDPRIHDGS
jgi:hypothetical protein